MASNYQEILGNLKRKQFAPLYFLEGEETYFIDKISDYIEDNAISDAEKGFNQTILYGKETDHLTVIDTVKRYPMMAEKQVVILKEAQQMRDMDKLEKLFANPVPTTIFVVCHKYKTVDKRKAFAKTLKKSAVFFTSPKLYDNQIPGWIQGYLGEKGREISPKAAALLSEYLGTDLAKISNELDKLLLIIEAGREIKPADIEKNIGISKDYNVFELQNALGKRDINKSNRIIQYFLANPRSNPLVVVLGTLYAYFSKIILVHKAGLGNDQQLKQLLGVHPYFIKDYKEAAQNFHPESLEKIITYLHQYDLRSKGVGDASSNDGALLKELVYHILHA